MEVTATSLELLCSRESISTMLLGVDVVSRMIVRSELHRRTFVADPTRARDRFAGRKMRSFRPPGARAALRSIATPAEPGVAGLNTAIAQTVRRYASPSLPAG